MAATVSGWRSALAEWPLLVRIDARRPASWIGLAMAGSAAWAPGNVEAMAIAMLAVVAAVGDVPRPIPGRVDVHWLAERVAWAATGVVMGAASMAMTSGAGIGSTGLFSFLAVVATALILHHGLAEQLPAADVASVAMVVAAAAVMAGLAAGSTAAALAIWFAAAMGMPVSLRLARSAPAILPRGGDLVGVLTAHSPIRRALGRVAMITMIAAMAGWLLLDPERAGWAAILGVAWMTCLAAPAAILPADGGMRGVIETVARHMVVLSWPALVAAAVTGYLPRGPFAPLAVAAGMAITALVILLGGLISRALRTSRETAFAVVLALVAAAVLLLPVARSHDLELLFPAAGRHSG
jgi:hypothetical protein